LQFIHRQNNLKPNCFDRNFKEKFESVYSNYDTGISTENIQMAFRKVDDIRTIAARSVTKMAENNDQTASLLKHSQDVQILAKDF